MRKDSLWLSTVQISLSKLILFFSMSECERDFFFLVVNHGRNPGNLLLVSKVIVCVTGAILLVLCLYV